ncbi:MAG: hypothetical protein M1499_02670 [Firmicutes bacterium]|nr:hypothetical protein [Bacillota bacterium]
MPHDYGFPKYVKVADKRARAQKSLEMLKKKNPQADPIVIEGRKLARTWWGKAWNDNLESYSDYANRIGRGRSYVRHGAVLDLRLQPGRVQALVQGSQQKPYQIDISITPLNRKIWEEMISSCQGTIGSLQELLDGKFPRSLAELFTAHGQGLFPSPKEISLKCNCPDWALMCKHVAATLYGVGARLDDSPALFFELRGVDVNELVARAVAERTEALLQKSTRKSSRVIETDDLSDLFGISIQDSKDPDPKAESKRPREKSSRNRQP